MKKNKKIWITLLSTLLTFVVVTSGYTIYANIEEFGEGFTAAVCAEFFTDYEALYDGVDAPTIEELEGIVDAKWPASGLTCIKGGYHTMMNDFFDYKISLFIDMVNNSGDEFSTDEKFLIPPELGFIQVESECAEFDGQLATSDQKYQCKREKVIEFCENGENVSSYCVALEALYMYIDYYEILQIKTNGLMPIQEYNEMFEWAYNPSPFAMLPAYEFYRASTMRTSEIEKEIEDAEMVMLATVDAFNEFRLAYPMHVKYEAIIKELVKYKLKLKDVRNKVEAFPGQFVHVTSTSCP